MYQNPPGSEIIGGHFRESKVFKVQRERAEFPDSSGLQFDNAHYLEFTGCIAVIN